MDPVKPVVKEIQDDPKPKNVQQDSISEMIGIPLSGEDNRERNSHDKDLSR
jgi:hypothetical protein